MVGYYHDIYATIAPVGMLLQASYYFRYQSVGKTDDSFPPLAA